ncbi:MAG: D-glycero-beta-D-manno-heptose-7-phosphate kinase [Deltaproteobacteria bacterium]|nr:D-glycero-beta-D-manno-heptose-7-phosphate kinase [Deltaproteobacteria bacterium]
MSKKLIPYIERFSDARVLVIGDIIMDEYIWGDVSRISPEAPVPVVEVQRETMMLGGAANVATNIRSLGGQTIICGVVGNDSIGRKIIKEIKKIGSDTDGIVIEPERPSSLKTRIVAHNQQVVRFDRESRRELHGESLHHLLGYIKKLIRKIDAVVVADYGKGVISGRMMKGLRDLLRGSDILLAVDPKENNFKHYQGIDIITPNHHEAGAFCGFKIVDEKTLIKAGTQMLDTLQCRSVLITQGKDGMTLFESDGEIYHIPTVARHVFDVTGAGDTVIGTLCLGLASKMDMRSAAVVSNFAAGIVVGEVGTSTVTSEQLTKVIQGR